MRQGHSQGTEPARFLGRFALVALALFALWILGKPFYTATLVPPANWIMACQNLPLAFEQRGPRLLVAWRVPERRVIQLQLEGHELVYMNALAAAALLSTLPGWTPGSRARWALAVLVMLWAMHVFSFCAGGYSAVQDYVAGLSPEKRAELCGTGWEEGSTGWAAFLTRLVGSWGIWGTAVLVLLPWMLSAWRYLGLDHGPSQS